MLESPGLYDEYGKTWSFGSYRHGFAGMPYETVSDLYYARARMYNPRLGRFMQPDPIGYDDGMNMYAYVKGDPVNFIDPTGLQGSYHGRTYRNVGPATFYLPSVGIASGGNPDVRRALRRRDHKPASQRTRVKVEPDKRCQSLGNRIGNALEYGGKGVSYSGLGIAVIGAPAGGVGAAPGLVIAEIGGVLSTVGQVSQDIAFGRPAGEIIGRAAVNVLGARAVSNVVPSSVRSRLGDAPAGQAVGDIASATNNSLDPDRCPR